MSVYDTSVQTLLLSFCLDEDNFKKSKYDSKTNLITGKPDGRMFCVVNDKVELIKLVSGSSAAKEVCLHVIQYRQLLPHPFRHSGTKPLIRETRGVLRHDCLRHLIRCVRRSLRTRSSSRRDGRRHFINKAKAIESNNKNTTGMHHDTCTYSCSWLARNSISAFPLPQL